MKLWTTRPDQGRGGIIRGRARLSPTLLFHKWHAYDRQEEEEGGPEGEPKLSREGCAVEFLKAVAAASGAVLGAERTDPRSYGWWLEERYLPALQALGARFSEAETLWRLVVGFGVNPALESGLVLHRLYGHPYIPGSAVKGMVHHLAEMELVGRLDLGGGDDGGHPSPPDEAILRSFLDDAEEIHRLFGSLTVQEARDPAYAGAVPLPPRALLRGWRDRVDEETGRRIRRLLTHTGGRLVFYDAVPLSGGSDLLQPDLLNPHYRDYYGSEGKDWPPSDDQSPVPVYFLAVRPEVRFVFPYRLRSAVGHQEGATGVLETVQRWLESALTTWGAGAKTAAGYGYFHSVGHLSPQVVPEWQAARKRASRPKGGGRRGTEQGPGETAGEPGASPFGFTLGTLLRSADAGSKDRPGPTSLRKGQKVRAEVVEDTPRGFRLRLLDTGQDDLVYRQPVRWRVGQRLSVRIVSLHPDGRVKAVKP